MKRRSFFKTLAAAALAPLALTKAKAEPKSLVGFAAVPPKRSSVLFAPGEGWEIEYPSDIIQDNNGFDAAHIVHPPIIRKVIPVLSAATTNSLNRSFFEEIPPIPGGFPYGELRDLLWRRQPDYCRRDEGDRLVLVCEWKSYVELFPDYVVDII